MTQVKRVEGNLYYATATKRVAHGAPCAEDNFAGIALKQKAAPTATPLYTDVSVGEDFAILIKGEVEVPALGGAANGDLVYVDPTNNALTETATNNVELGRVTAQPGERGTPAGRMKVNLDVKV